MIIFEVVAAVLVALAAVATVVGPLTRPGAGPAAGVAEPEEFEETPRGMALAALREIEFDRATGKLSDEDYRDLHARYTVEALAVIRAEDAGPSPGSEAASASPLPGESPGDAVEAMVARRVAAMTGPAGLVRCPACGPRPEGDALFCSSCGRSLAPGGCAGCGAPLVPGSRFCEGCGQAVGA